MDECLGLAEINKTPYTSLFGSSSLSLPSILPCIKDFCGRRTTRHTIAMSEAATTHFVEDEPTKPQEEPGFVGLLVQSVFEVRTLKPPANKGLTLGIAWRQSRCGYGYVIWFTEHYRKAWLMNTSYERVFLPPHPYSFRPRLLNAMEQARPTFARCHLTTLGIYGLVRLFHAIYD